MIEDYLTAWLQFIVGIGLFVTVCNIKLDTSELTKIIKLYVIIGVVTASFGIMQLIGSYWGYDLLLSFTNVGRADPHSGYEAITGAFKRPTSFFSEPRQFGNYLVPIWSVLFIVILSKLPIFKKYISYLFAIVTCLGIISSLSASAYFTLLTSTFVLSVYFFRKRAFKSIFVTLVLVFFIIFIINAGLRQSETTFIGSISKMVQRFEDILKIYSQFQSMEYRTFGLFRYVGNMRLAYDTWKQSPLIGVGLNNLEYYSKYGLSGAHPPFRFLAETGTLGSISFLFFIIVFLRKYKSLLSRLYTADLDKSLALIGIFLILTTIIASFGSTYRYSSIFFWFNLSLSGLIYFNLQRKYLRMGYSAS